MSQQQSWYAAMFLNTCAVPDHALSEHVEGGAWAVRLEGSPSMLLYTILDVTRYMAGVHDMILVRPPRGE